MYRLIKKLFSTEPKPPIFPIGTMIQFENQEGARLNTPFATYLSIPTDTVLVFIEEMNGVMFFRCIRYYQPNEKEVDTNDVVYLKTKHVQEKRYKIIPR